MYSKALHSNNTLGTQTENTIGTTFFTIFSNTDTRYQFLASGIANFLNKVTVQWIQFLTSPVNAWLFSNVYSLYH